MNPCVFPGLAQKPCGELALDALALEWRKNCPDANAANPFLDPVFCREEIGKAQRARGWEWSYGGYLEDRRHVWGGSYLERTGQHINDAFHCPGCCAARQLVGKVLSVIVRQVHWGRLAPCCAGTATLSRAEGSRASEGRRWSTHQRGETRNL